MRLLNRRLSDEHSRSTMTKKAASTCADTAFGGCYRQWVINRISTLDKFRRDSLSCWRCC